MRYRKLELLLMSVGLVGIAISILVSLLNGARPSELIGQALFMPVLVLALHYGRHYGYASAIIAAMILLMLKTREMGPLDLGAAGTRLVLLQAVAFGLVGILAGELAARIKYVVAKIADEEFVHDETKVFSQHYIVKLIAKLLSGYERNGRPFTIIVLDINWQSPTTAAAKSKQLARIANVLRSHVRLVDEVAHLDDGRFCLVLPDTPPSGAQTVHERLRKAYAGSRRLFHFSAEWTERILSMPDDENEIRALAPPALSIKVTA